MFGMIGGTGLCRFVARFLTNHCSQQMR
jgi:hypothetical protein